MYAKCIHTVGRRWSWNNDTTDNTYETAEWPKGFTEVTMIALKKKPKATQSSDNRTISLIAHTANIVVTTLRWRIQRKTEDALVDQCAFRRWKGTRNATGKLRITTEWTLYIAEELRVFFVDWQMAFDRVRWTKLKQIIKGNGIDWCKWRLIGKLYVDQC